MSDESDEEMEVEGTVLPATPTTPRPIPKPPKHDLMMTDEVMINIIDTHTLKQTVRTYRTHCVFSFM